MSKIKNKPKYTQFAPAFVDEALGLQSQSRKHSKSYVIPSPVGRRLKFVGYPKKKIYKEKCI